MVSSHDIKRHLLLGRKAMTNLDSILKSRDITLPTKAHLVKTMLFPVVMYGYKSWIIKKAERRRTDAFKLWCWRRLLRVSWTVRSNQSILKEISPEYSLEGLTLKLKLQYFGHLMEELTHLKRPWCWERFQAKGEGVSQDEMVRQHHQFNGHEYEQTPGDSESQESLACCSPYDHKGLWHELVTGQQKKISSTLNKGREPNKS